MKSVVESDSADRRRPGTPEVSARLHWENAGVSVFSGEAKKKAMESVLC